MTLPALNALQKKHRAIMRAHGLTNCKAIILARVKVDIPLPQACALMSMESGGANIYGHDAGGAMSVPGRNVLVTEVNFKTFRHLVLDLHHTSNGVGPCQITWSGYFPDMESKGLKPWVAYDNMRYGFEILKSHHATSGSWQSAAAQYNGSGPAAAAYGRTYMERLAMWEHLL